MESTAKVVVEKFIEINVEKVPEALQIALKTTYPEAFIEKTFINKKKGIQAGYYKWRPESYCLYRCEWGFHKKTSLGDLGFCF